MDQIIEMTSRTASQYLSESRVCPNFSVDEFVDSTEIEIGNRIRNLYELEATAMQEDLLAEDLPRTSWSEDHKSHLSDQEPTLVGKNSYQTTETAAERIDMAINRDKKTPERHTEDDIRSVITNDEDISSQAPTPRNLQEIIGEDY